MVSVFRKIRKELAADSKFAKYMRYAIGEIALVVIGILIALQINNWNDQRKNDIEIENLFTSLEKDLEKNIYEVSGLVNFGYYMDSLAQKWLDRKVDREMILNNSDYSNIIYYTHTIRFIDDNLQELLRLEKQLPKNYERIIPMLKELKTLSESQEKWEKIGVNIIVENDKYMSENFSWTYDRDSLAIEKRIDYCLNDPIFRNRVYRWKEIQLEENAWDATQLRSFSLILLWKIRSIRGSNRMLSFKDFLMNYKLVSFDNIECEKSFDPEENTSHYRSSYIFHNTMTQTVNLHFLNDKEEIRMDIKLEAGEYFANKFNLREGTEIHCITEDNCIRKYRTVDNGYCIIE